MQTINVYIERSAHTTKGADKTCHVKYKDNTIGTIDWLSTGQFKSYVNGKGRFHSNLKKAIMRIQRNYLKYKLTNI